ncbi:hypothetical protein MLD52_03530 [Puniceicoccaceae bacterium K14]|nr:hypothetical protein [Puniceicoccaceae bacterium K14]
MKKFAQISLLWVGLAYSYLYGNTSTQVTKLWETENVFLGPEAVVYDAVRDFLYVSNVHLKNKDKRTEPPFTEFISKVSTDGKIIDREWIPNLNCTTGMVIYQDKLYAIERGAFLVINLKQGILENRIQIENTGFLNDVTVDCQGTFYITDSRQATVYRIKNEVVEKWLVSDEIAKPNGILCDGDKLIIGVNSDNYLKSIDLKSKTVTKIAFLDKGGIDGISKYKNDYLVSHVAGNLYHITTDGQVIELLNSREENLKIADIGFIEDKQLILAPILNKEIVIGYKLDLNK